MAKTPAATPTPKPEKPVETSDTRRERLSRLVADIENHNHSLLREALVERLFDSGEGFRVRTVGDVTHVTMAGIKAQSTAQMHGALSNWAMNARRELLELGPAE